MERSERGYTLVEILVALVMLAIVAGLAIPSFLAYTQRSRLDAAVRQIVEDVREARSRATMRSWQYRIYGFNYGAASAYKNQYRLMGRSSSAVAWAADTATPFETATQMVGMWNNMSTTYPGVRINPADGTDHFWVAFDARGIAIDVDDSFNPLQLTHQTGGTKSVSVTTAGSVRIQ
jgi:prepilin-type N-terminal cleavage/methylation domain-containing protein